MDPAVCLAANVPACMIDPDPGFIFAKIRKFPFSARTPQVKHAEARIPF
jgi:hypothetical protein